MKPDRKLAVKIAFYGTMIALVFSVAIGLLFSSIFGRHGYEEHLTDIDMMSRAFYRGLFIFAVGVVLSVIISYFLYRQSEQIRRDFVANISHELRTPITVIRGSLEAITEKIVTDPEKIEEYHNKMLDETKLLQKLVNDLLNFSKVAS